MPMTPEKVLSSNLNKEITVTLKNGSEYRGTLKNFDEYLNLALENVEEKVGEKINKLDSILINGYNVRIIVPK